VGSNSREWGADIGESVLRDGKVIDIFDKRNDTLGKGGDLLPAGNKTTYRPSPFAEQLPTTDYGSQLSQVEKAIAPTGMKGRRLVQMMDAQGNPTRFGSDLLEAVPEISKATPETAPQVLTQGIRRAESGIESVSNQIPPETPVPLQKTAEAMDDLVQSYREAGNELAAKAVEKEWLKWGEYATKGDGTIPFAKFRELKRTLGEAMKSSTPLKRSYYTLMEATNDISKDLAAANRTYSVIRRAAEAGGIDIFTGRRLNTVGKPIK
jgi:hypothetical protein